MIVSAEEFIRLRTSTDPADYERAAGEAAPVEVWRTVIADHPDHRFWVAQNRLVPVEILTELADCDDARVRWMVASHPHATPTLLDHLATDPSEAVRAAVARHPTTAPGIREGLRHDPSTVVRDAARHPT